MLRFTTKRGGRDDHLKHMNRKGKHTDLLGLYILGKKKISI
jgi:hypothetical protein